MTDIDTEREKWLVHDEERDNLHVCHTRAEVRSKEEVAEFIDATIGIYPPGKHPDDGDDAVRSESECGPEVGV